MKTIFMMQVVPWTKAEWGLTGSAHVLVNRFAKPQHMTLDVAVHQIPPSPRKGKGQMPRLCLGMGGTCASFELISIYTVGLI